MNTLKNSRFIKIIGFIFFCYFVGYAIGQAYRYFTK